jgi:hypothetical protein
MYQKLQVRPVSICPTYSSITNWARALDRWEDISMRASGSGRLPDSTIDFAMTERLEISPFHLIRSLASTIKRSPTTVWTHLHCMSFVIKHHRFVPQKLSPVQRNERVQHSINLKKIFKSARHRRWRYVLTGDESWFYFTINHEKI